MGALGLGEAEGLYRIMFDLHGWSPREVDDCELWELTLLLVRDQTSSNGQAPNRGLTGRALLEARVRAAREGRPPPSFGPRDIPLN
jgi:hypothetical protein